ncbi:MAG: hypothetical protein AAF990_13505, partial [Bacteroidota bacterium]
MKQIPQEMPTPFPPIIAKPPCHLIMYKLLLETYAKEEEIKFPLSSSFASRGITISNENKFLQHYMNSAKRFNDHTQLIYQALEQKIKEKYTPSNPVKTLGLIAKLLPKLQEIYEGQEPNVRSMLALPKTFDPEDTQLGLDHLLKGQLTPSKSLPHSPEKALRVIYPDDADADDRVDLYGLFKELAHHFGNPEQLNHTRSVRQNYDAVVMVV